ncbi:MAG TPA: hypothetical protein VFK69_02340 [Candidatus Eisenbacteria bacterium]|nr:hypothetical protein [Candidatus Eisenbacteria bacterium]
MPSERQALAGRREAARRWQPKKIRLLLVAEGPPRDPGRGFYLEQEREPDPLFQQVCEVLFEASPPDKVAGLKELRRRGVFALELIEAPEPRRPMADYVTALALKLEELAPAHVVLVGAGTYDAAHGPLARAGVPVVGVRVPFAASGSDAAFRREFRRAVVRAGLEQLIRPLKAPGAKPAKPTPPLEPESNPNPKPKSTPHP